MEIDGIVACRQICGADQVGALDGSFPEAQVADGETAGLFGIVLKIALYIQG